MNHTASARFWRCYESLPADVQALADKNFGLLKEDPSHPSLQFKLLGGNRLYSARVGLHYRALGCPVRTASTGSGSAPTRSTTVSSAPDYQHLMPLTMKVAGLSSAGPKEARP